MAASRLTALSSYLSRRGLLTILAGNSVLWRVLPDLPTLVVARLADLLASGQLGTAFLAGLSVAVSRGWLAAGSQWLLFLYFIYAFVPRLYPGETDAVFERRGFRALIAGLTVAIAAFVSGLLACNLYGPISSNCRSTLLVGTLMGLDTLGLPLPGFSLQGVILMGVSWIGVSVYVYRHRWRATPIEDRIEFYERMVTHRPDDDIAAAFARDDVWGTITNALPVILAGGVFMLFSVVLGAVVGAIGLLSPVPEVIVLSAVIVGRAGALLPRTRTLSNGIGRVVDIEPRFYRSAQYAIRGPKGRSVAVLLLVTLVISTGVAFAGTALVLDMVWGFVFEMRRGLATESPGPTAIGIWILVGAHVCLVAAGWYAVWFWIREIRRLPHFIRYWVAQRPITSQLEDTDEPRPPVARPPGHLLAPSGLLVVLVGFELLTDLRFIGLGIKYLDTLAAILLMGLGTSYDHAANASAAGVLGLLFAIAWPVLIIVAGWTIHRARRSEPQPVDDESRILIGALLLQIGWVWLLSIDAGWPLTAGDVATVVTLLLSVYYIGDVIVYSSEAKAGPRHYSVGGFIVLAGVVIAVIARVFRFAYFDAESIFLSGSFIMGLGVVGTLISYLIPEELRSG